MELVVYNTWMGWTWKIVDANKKVHCRSAKYYRSKSDCKRAFEKLDRMF